MFSLQVQLQKQGYYEGCRKQNEEVKREKDKKRRSGTNRAKEWKFFTKMDGFMSQKHNVNPPSVTDTMAERHTQNTVQTKQSSDRILTAYLSLVLFSRKLVHHMC